MTQKLQNHIQNGYSVNIGQYFSRGYELFKANAASHIVFALVFFIISTILAFIPFVNFIASLITTPISYGIFLVCFKYVSTNSKAELGDYFKGFDYFGSIILPTLITAIILIIVVGLLVGYTIFPALLSGDKGAILESVVSKWYLFFVALIIFFYVSLINSVAIFIAVFHGEGVFEAYKLGFQFVNKNPVLLFLFTLINSLLLAAGFLFLFIGILFTYPLFMCNSFAMFEDLLGLPETDGDNLNDNLINSIGEDYKLK
jgi:hypothetical protein